MTHPDIEALRFLLVRVEGATESDRVLGIDLLSTLCPDDYARGNSPGDDDPVFLLARMGGSGFHVIDDIDPTASLDAAVALVERTLPGWPIITRTSPQATGPSRNVADVIFVSADEKAWGAHHEAGGATMSLALCAALLRALIARAGAEKDPS